MRALIVLGVLVGMPLAFGMALHDSPPIIASVDRSTSPTSPAAAQVTTASGPTVPGGKRDALLQLPATEDYEAALVHEFFHDRVTECVISGQLKKRGFISNIRTIPGLISGIRTALETGDTSEGTKLRIGELMVPVVSQLLDEVDKIDLKHPDQATVRKCRAAS
jgi:hypothetical protein